MAREVRCTVAMAEQNEDGVGERVVEQQMRLLDVDNPPTPQLLGAARAAAWLAGWHRAMVRMTCVEWEGAEEWEGAYVEGYEAGRVIVEASGGMRRGRTVGSARGELTGREPRRWWLEGRDD